MIELLVEKAEKVIIFIFISLNLCVLGAQKNRLIEMTHNICLGWEIRILIFNYTPLSVGVVCIFAENVLKFGTYTGP